MKEISFISQLRLQQPPIYYVLCSCSSDDAVSILGRIKSENLITVTDELEGMWKEAVVT